MSDAGSLHDTERAVLAAALRDEAIREILFAAATPDWFNAIQHRTLFGAMRKVAMLGQPIDAPTILRAAREGRASVADVPLDPEWLRESWALATSVTAESLEKSHLPELRRGFQTRALQILSSELLERCAFEDPSEVASWLQTKTDGILASRSVSAPSTDADILESIRTGESEDQRGPYCGIMDVASDLRLTPRKFTIVGGRPGHGKSSCARQIAVSAASQGVAVAYFAIEEGKAGWAETRIQMLTGESYENFIMGRASARAMRVYGAYYSAAYESKLYVYDNDESYSAYDIVSRVRRLKRAEPTLGVVIVDQLQQIAGWHANARGEGRDLAPTRILTEVVQGCKALDVHLIAVHQLSRDLEKGGKKREPIMSDLADAAVLERLADNVLFVWRPNIEERDDLDAVAIVDDEVIVKYGKRRRAKPSRHRLGWDGRRTIIGRWQDPILAVVEREIDGPRPALFGEAS